MKTAIAHYRAYTAKSQFLVCIVFLTIAVFSILFSATCFGKTVLLDIDGEQQQLFVFAKDVEDAERIINDLGKLANNGLSPIIMREVNY